MGARTGRQYIKGLQDQQREVWLGGERVKDVTTHPGLANGVRAIAALYDMQHDAALRDDHEGPDVAGGAADKSVDADAGQFTLGVGHLFCVLTDQGQRCTPVV